MIIHVVSNTKYSIGMKAEYDYDTLQDVIQDIIRAGGVISGDTFIPWHTVAKIYVAA